MHFLLPLALLQLLTLLCPLPHRASRNQEVSDELSLLQVRVLQRYAEQAHDLYLRCERHAVSLRTAVDHFLDVPSPESLAGARAAWLTGRADYGRTEVLRFYGGPIDNSRSGVETYLNAWPVDESYIAGIVADPEGYPVLDETMLVLLNERGGEKNVCIGWHAIEFLLWGPDLDPDGPGNRPHTDYVPSASPQAERRAQLLRACTDLLVRHHRLVRLAWLPEAENYRGSFLSAPPGESLRRVLAGMVILSGFEMSGERLAVAYETRDQEEEHSCFSDNTHVDFLANQQGLMAVWTGDAFGSEGPGLDEVARLVDPDLARQVELDLVATREALEQLPVPFDRALGQPEESPERQALLRALLALERQSETLATLGLSLGYEIAIHPGG